MSGDTHEAIVLAGLAVVGLIQMALRPRKTLALLRGRGWYE